ncbi:MAG: N-6 DNA methylase [Ignavibacteriae bacterium]|nr:N-6 DNA methylase [Ignavibacteriota bacterium]
MKDIIKELEKIQAMGYEAHRIFSDWLDLMLYSFLGDEEFYLTVAKRYRNTAETGQREIDFFKNACQLLLAKMKKSNDELLGEIYMKWNLTHKNTGQIFTPKHIAGFMAKMLEPYKREVISDPCCGAGVLLIETCKLMSYQSLNQTLFIGQDINHTCVKMCALNLLFFNLNGYAILGDTLNFEYLKVYQTSRSCLGGSIRVLTDEEAEAIKPKVLMRSKLEISDQITLF